MKRTALACMFTAYAAMVSADSLPVTAEAVFTFQGREITISRVSALPDATVSALSQTPATCQSPCLTPMAAAVNVPTLGELDVIDFLSRQVEDGTGLLIDARLPDSRTAGLIPASVNIPAATMAPSNPFRDEILIALGARQFQGLLNFNDAMSLVIYDAGPGTTDAPTLINDLLAAGYPPEKIAYYRGGMLVWSALGLTTTDPSQ